MSFYEFRAVNEADIAATLENGGKQQNTPEYYLWMAKQYIKYLGFCPEIRELTPEGRVSPQFPSFCILNFQALLYWKNSLLFGTFSHEYYSWLAKKLPSSSSTVLTTAETLFTKTELTEVEFVILKILCLLSPGYSSHCLSLFVILVESPSEEGQAGMIVARTRFINLLTDIGKMNEAAKEVDYDRTGVLLDIPAAVNSALSSNSFTPPSPRDAPFMENSRVL